MVRLLLVCLAGAVGTGLRYGANLAVPRLLGISLPYGTLAVNVVGSFVLSLIMYLSLVAGSVSPTTRLVLGTGFCGGLTTYSTFNYETLRAFQDGEWLRGGLNVTVTLVSCMVAGLLGIAAGTAIAGK